MINWLVLTLGGVAARTGKGAPLRPLTMGGMTGFFGFANEDDAPDDSGRDAPPHFVAADGTRASGGGADSEASKVAVRSFSAKTCVDDLTLSVDPVLVVSLSSPCEVSFLGDAVGTGVFVSRLEGDEVADGMGAGELRVFSSSRIELTAADNNPTLGLSGKPEAPLASDSR